MDHRFAEIAFTPREKKDQERGGRSRGSTQFEKGEPHRRALGPNEAAFIASREGLYVATISETGWPYIQHRGGPKGFLRVLDEQTIGFVDFREIRQCVSVRNLHNDSRVSLILVDYPQRTRLTVLGRARMVDAENRELLQRLSMPDYGTKVARGFLITVEAFDWNCAQHITHRFTLTKFEEMTVPLRKGIGKLEESIAGNAREQP
jgi:predicted pyridoxine 5'-phosphate oxidase superfamily flavin-nucleotide-binding protein